MKIASDFLMPVDWKFWKMWDYPKVVEHPMDLESVKVFIGYYHGEYLEFFG